MAGKKGRKKRAKRALWDHVKEGNTFYPPFMAGKPAGFIQELDWFRELVPELVWVALVVRQEGFLAALDLLSNYARIADEAAALPHKAHFGRTVDHYGISSPCRDRLLASLRESGLLGRLAKAICPLVRLYPECPLGFLVVPEADRENPPSDEDLKIMGDIVHDLMDKGEQVSIWSQAICQRMAEVTGKTGFLEGGPPPLPLELLIDYPDVPSTHEIAGNLRACTTGLKAEGLIFGLDLEKWCKYFWHQGQEGSGCNLIYSDGVRISDFGQEFISFSVDCFRKYYDDSSGLIGALLYNYRSDHGSIAEDIVRALVTRVYRLAIQCISFLPNWTADIAESLLRLAVDSYIQLKWLLECAERSDFQAFYEYGIGQQKLMAEHTRVYLENLGLSPDEVSERNTALHFVKRHKMPEMTPVKIGNWSQKTTRVMAQEAGLNELYVMVYTPTSSTIHGTYDSLDRFCLLQCINPLHGFHRVPHYWGKPPISTYAVSNIAHLADSVMDDMLEIVGLKKPETFPGADFIERILSYELDVDSPEEESP